MATATVFLGRLSVPNSLSRENRKCFIAFEPVSLGQRKAKQIRTDNTGLTGWLKG